jgi:polysaccharide biosynthesis/export protein
MLEKFDSRVCVPVPFDRRRGVFALKSNLIFCLAATFLTFGLAGCLPVSGPSSADIRKEAGTSKPTLAYDLVRVTPTVVNVLAKNLPRLTNVFADKSPPQDITFGVGDVVSVTIFESVAGGLFIPAEAAARPGNFITLPNQQVDSKGNISVPYAGNIRTAGRTQVQVQKEIVDALAGRAVEPQVVVSLVEQKTSLISVLGDVGSASRLTASQAGEHILDAITRAGGPRSQGYDEWVMLERNGKRALAPFGALVYEPSNNIFVHPEDTIFLYREPQTFLAFGAIGSQQQFNFDTWRLSLAEAVAKTGGLNDIQADPSSVFLYRGEPRDVAVQLGIDVSKYQGPIVPVVYELNFRDPSEYFLASSFEMRNKDVLYVSNADSVELVKVLSLFSTVLGTANDPINTALQVVYLKNAIKQSSSAAAAVVTVAAPAVAH